MRQFLAGTLAMLTVACAPAAAPECTKAADCGAATTTSCQSCPGANARYCEGQKCKDPPAKRTVTLDLSTPRNLDLKSTRYVAYSIRSAKEIASCAGGAGCAADAVTCETVQAEGMSSTNLNVALSGATNTDTQNGSITLFQGITMGELPSESALVILEGMDGTLGNGTAVARVCTMFAADSNKLTATLTRL